MPDLVSLREAARVAVGATLFDIATPQAIFEVEVTPEPENATITFRTTKPAYATVELFRMQTGTIALDMEKANRERIEVELFGDASTVHRVRFFDLPQERRFWFRISVPGEGPGTALGQKKVRYRSWFSTLRRTAKLRLNSILIISDSDDNSAGDLSFALGIYNSATSDLQLVPPRLTGERSFDSGQIFRTPFGGPIDLGRAPDRIAVYVGGHDNDVDFDDFFLAPFEGVPLYGRRPPEHIPRPQGPVSDRTRDDNDILLQVQLPVTVGQRTVEFHGTTPIGRLVFEVNGSVECSVIDVLGQPVKLADIIAKLGRAALTPVRRTGGKTKKGNMLLALGEDGQLLYRLVDEARAGWHEAPGPAVGLALLQALPGGMMLAAQATDGRLWLLPADAIADAEPRWQETPLVLCRDNQQLPATAVTNEGHLLITACDHAGRLVSLLADAEGQPLAAPQVLHERCAGMPVAGTDRKGRILLVFDAGEGQLRLATLAKAGDRAKIVDPKLDALPLLGIARDADGEAVVVALDGRGEIHARSIREDGPWQGLGSLEQILEPDLTKVPDHVAPGTLEPAEHATAA